MRVIVCHYNIPSQNEEQKIILFYKNSFNLKASLTLFSFVRESSYNKLKLILKFRELDPQTHLELSSFSELMRPENLIHESYLELMLMLAPN